jgi:nitrogen regulatory protein P-II 1
MKKIEAVVRPSTIGDVCTALNRIGHHGIMITEIAGQGNQRGVSQQSRGKTCKVDLRTKARLQVIANDAEVDNIVDAICKAACTGEADDGKIFIYPVDDVIRIRTSERGAVAV